MKNYQITKLFTNKLLFGSFLILFLTTSCSQNLENLKEIKKSEINSQKSFLVLDRTYFEEQLQNEFKGIISESEKNIKFKSLIIKIKCCQNFRYNL